MSATVTNNIKAVALDITNKTPDAMFATVQRAGGVVLSYAKATAPKNVAKQLIQKPKNKGLGPEAWISFKKDEHWYLKFFESGTKAHVIKAKKGPYLCWPIGMAGNFKFGRKWESVYKTKNGKLTTDSSEVGGVKAPFVNHPGEIGTHFLGDAGIKTRAQQKKIITDGIMALFGEAVSKI